MAAPVLQPDGRQRAGIDETGFATERRESITP
jgi:hypothetical protein